MKTFISTVLTLLISVPLFAAAASGAFFETGENLSLALPFTDDLYAAGCPVILESDIAGDASVVGCIVTISGEVSEDLNVAAGVMTVDGNVGDDMRAGGGEVTINSTIGDDLFVGGGTVNISRTAVIKGDLIIGGGRVNMNGTVEGNLRMGSGMVMLDGPVAGETMIYGGSVMVNSVLGGNSVIAADEIMLGASAQFGGDLDYWTAGGEVDFTEAAIAGEVTYDPSLSYEKYTEGFEMDEADVEGIFAGIALGFAMFWFFSGALLILLFSLLTKKFFKNVAVKLNKEPLKAFVAGLVYFVVVPVAAFLVMFTVIGIPLGIITFVMYLITVYLACIITSIVLSNWVILRWKLKWGRVAQFFLSLLIYALLGLLYFVPILGWAVKIIVVMLAFGAYILHKLELQKKFA